MAGFSDRLNAMKASQESGDAKKKESAAAEAQETANKEREAKLDEVTKRRESVGAEFSAAEVAAEEASEAISQAEAFATEQGENLDPAAKEEIDAIKVEASAVMQKHEDLKVELAEIDAELAELNMERTSDIEEADSSVTQETSTETVEEASDEEIPEDTTQESAAEVGEEATTEEGSGKESQGEMNLEEMKKSQGEKEDAKEKMDDEIRILRVEFKKVNKEYRKLKETDPEAAEALKNEAEEDGGVLKTLNDLVGKTKEVVKEIKQIKIEVAEKKIDSALLELENMRPPEDPNSHTASVYDEKLAKVFVKFNHQLEDLSEGDDVKKFESAGVKVAESMERKMDEFINNSRDVANFNPSRGYATATISKNFYLLAEVAPTSIENQAAHVLEGVSEDMKGKTPDEIRKALYASGNNASLNRSLAPIFDKLSKGEKISNNAEEALKKVLPLLRSSDSSQIMGSSEDSTSRFLTGGRINHVRRGPNREDKDEYVERVQNALQEIENE